LQYPLISKYLHNSVLYFILKSFASPLNGILFFLLLKTFFLLYFSLGEHSFEVQEVSSPDEFFLGTFCSEVE